jgi:hypothetical protein
MGCVASSASCGFVVIGVPIIIAAIGLGTFFGLKYCGRWDSFLESTERIRTFFMNAFYITIGLLTYVQLINAWSNLTQGSTLYASPQQPGFFGFGKRCVPLFQAVQPFISENTNTSALYQYDITLSNFDAQVRLCTDAPSNVVSTFAESKNFTLEPTLPYFTGCPWEIIGRNCQTEYQTITCAQLMQTPPLPNGFLYKAKNINKLNPVPPNCAATFSVYQDSQDLPPCNFRYVYRISNNVSTETRMIGGGFLAISSVVFFTAFFFLCHRSYKKSHGQQLTQDDEDYFAFVLQTTVGKIFGNVFHCWCMTDAPGRLTMFYFLLLLAGSITEIAVFWVSIVPCCLCGFIELYYLIACKIVATLLVCYDFVFDNPPKPKKSERIENLHRHADS